jgi:hypothetical protein
MEYMDLAIKKSAFDKVIFALKRNPDITDLVIKDSTDDFIFTATIVGSVSFAFTIRSKADLFILKADTQIMEMTGSEIYELGAEMTENTKIAFVSYDNTLVFQYVTALAPEKEAPLTEKDIFNHTMELVSLFQKYQDRMHPQSKKSTSTTSINVDIDSDDVDDDPYGFNALSLEMANGEVGDEEEEEEDDEEDSDSDDFDDEDDDSEDEDSDGDEVDEEEDDEEPDDEDVGDESDEEELGEEPGEEEETPVSVVNVDSDEEDDLDALLEEVEAEEEKLKAFQAPVATVVTPAPEKVDAEADKVDDEAEADDVADETEDEESDDEMWSGTSLYDQIVSGDVVDSDTPDTWENADFNGEAEEQDEEDDESEPVVVLNGDEDTVAELSHVAENGEEREDDEAMSDIKYERAPEVVEQMKHLYAEVDQVFVQRKKQCDYREQTLDQYAERLTRHEAALKQQAQDNQQAYEQQKAEIAAERDSLTTEREEVQFQWKKLNAERDQLAVQQKDFEEKVRIFEASQELGLTAGEEDVNILEDLRSRLADCTTELEQKSSECASLQAQIDALTAQLQDTEAQAQQATISPEAVAEYEAQIQGLNEVSAKKDRIIQSFKEKRDRWTARETKYKEQIAQLEATPTVDPAVEQELEDEKKKNAVLTVNTTQLTEQVTTLTAQVTQVEEDNTTMQQSIESMKNETQRLAAQLEQAQADVKAAEEETKQAKAELRAATDKNNIAVGVQASLQELGITMEVVAGAGELLLMGETDNCKVVVNVDVGILYVEKAVKRGYKNHAALMAVEKWNQESIRAAYILSDHKVVCKYIYNDVRTAVTEVIRNLSTLN